MNYVAVDTSGKYLSVVVCKNDKPEVFFEENCGVNHSVKLMPVLEELLDRAKLSLKDVDFFACVVGAGSFTGIRIGVSTVKALCFSNKKPCLKITSFDTLAYNRKGKVLAVIDAGHNGYYVAGYLDKKLILNPKYVLKEELLNLSKEYVLVSFDNLDFTYEKVSVLNGLISAIQEKRGDITLIYEELSPLYCRQSQAEEGRK